MFVIVQDARSLPKRRCSGKMLILAVFFDLRVLAHHGPLVLLGSGPSLYIVRERTVVSQWEHETRPSKNLIYKLEKALLISTYLTQVLPLRYISSLPYIHRAEISLGAVR